MRIVLSLLLVFMLPTAGANGLLDQLPGLGGKPQASFLPAEQAFGLELLARDTHTLQANFKITPSYYLYRDKISFTIAGNAPVQIVLPRGDIKEDPNFGAIEVFHNSFQGVITLPKVDVSQPIVVHASYQGCSDQGLCYPPIERTFSIILAQTVSATTPEVAAPLVDENSQIATLFKSGNFWLIISFFFGAGLLLALTPCVFPMIPILSGIIVGRGHKITHMHAFMLSVAYVLGMAITYAVAGVAAGLSGELLSSALQTPWVLGSFAALFVLLSLSMFGFYELQLPSALQSRLSDTSNKLHGGHLTGVFAMGALSAVIMGPCVAAPLAGALLYISQTHDAVLGGVALFVLALGMGVPLLMIGSSAGALLPRVGAWMESVKRIFGVMMLALAIWIVSPVIPVGAHMLLWAALLLFSGIYLRALDSLPHNTSGWLRMRKGAGIIALLVGVSYLIGALSGARDLLHPLGYIGQAGSQSPATLQFVRVKDLAELKQRIAQAEGRAVMLDFYADWCVSCKEMELNTFADSAVQAKLKPVLVLQADVTANSEADKLLLKHFGLYGPPGILFFDNQGLELGDIRVVGYQDAVQFMQTLKRAGL